MLINNFHFNLKKMIQKLINAMRVLANIKNITLNFMIDLKVNHIITYIYNI